MCRSAPSATNVLLTAAGGQCIRFPVTDVRGVLGAHLDGCARASLCPKCDRLISLAILAALSMGDFR